jgi:cyanophycin synthetase
VSPSGYAVLNADDPLVVEMAARCPGEVVFFTTDPNHPVIVRHRGVGGRAVFIRDHHVVIAEGDREEIVLSLDRVPLTRNGQITFQVENSLASIAAAWCLGISLDVIRTRSESIAADIDKVPGRFNVLEIEGATVVVDYGHNSHSLAAVIQAMSNFPHERRTCVYSTAGDRRDCDIIRQGELLGAAFDRVVLYEDHYRRGRTQGEIVGLFRKGLESASRTTEIVEVEGATKAAEMALSSAQPGELVLLQADAIDETVHWLRDYLETLASRTSGDVIEQVLGESGDVPASMPGQIQTATGETITPAKMQNGILAEAHTVAKV